MRSWLEWLAESTNEKSSAMGRWYLGQLANGCGLEDAAFPDLQIQENADGTSVAAGLVVFQQPEMELYQRLVATARLKQLWKNWCGCCTQIFTSTTRRRAGTSNGLEEE